MYAAAPMTYAERRGHPADFLVRYRFLTEEEGGRYSGPPGQHYRGDWAYEGELPGIYMIYPEFLDSNGEPLPESGMAPWAGLATMWILVPQMRALHRSKVRAGVRGHFMEGSKVVAHAEVIAILGLGTNPDA